MSHASGPKSPPRHSPIGQLTLARLREFLREPEAVFWVYGFPIMMAILLGVAFRERPVDKIRVDVQDGRFASVAMSAFAEAKKFLVETCDENTCRTRLRTSKTDLVIVSTGESTPSFDYLYDPSRGESVLARREADEALQRAAGRRDVFAPKDREFKEPGGRYIDFLVPGLLGMSIMGGGLWGVGFVTVDMRIRKLLKRFLATPMKKTHFLGGIMLSRLCFLLPEVAILIVFAAIAFGVRIYGSLLSTTFLILLGATTFSGVGLLVASRAKTIEAVSGLMNLVMLPMWLLSGIFFSSSRYPDVAQPFIRALPLTALNDALRAVMIDGSSIFTQLDRVLLLTVYAVVTFVTALKIFRWQ
jgi:ABC-type multidrug transport system permease subunit